MLISDINLGNEGIVIAAITAAFGALIGAIVYLFKKSEVDQAKLVANYERQRTFDLADSKSWQEMASLAVENIEQVANKKRKTSGEGPIKSIVPVVPEHASPTTEQQRATADIQTMRARLVAATLSLDLEARPVTRDASPEEEAALKTKTES